MTAAPDPAPLVAPPSPAPAAPRRALGRARIAAAWAAAAFLGLAALSGGPGVSEDEAAVIAAADAGAAPLDRAGPAPVAPLEPLLARATHAVGSRLGLPHRTAYRLAGALAGAALAGLLALLGHGLVGPAGALLAPALYLAAPRALGLAVAATPDTALAALVLGTLLAYRLARSGRRRLVAALTAGGLFGLALCARVDAVLLLAALILHALVSRLVRRRDRAAALAAAGEDPAAAAVEARLRGVPLALAAMAVVGPLLLALLWPTVLAHPLRELAPLLERTATIPYLGARLVARVAASRPPPAYPWVVTALATPLALLLCEVGGVVHTAARLVRALAGRAPDVDAGDELLLLLTALAPIAAAQMGLVPPGAGIGPWLPALPILAALGARALLATARVAWPARARPLAASLALLVIAPAARAALHAWPTPGASWGELAGGTPGAATRGMARQERGEAAAAVLAALRERASPGARIHWIGVAPEAVRLYARDGLLRPDLALADDIASADLAVVLQDGGSRDAEYQAWAALRTDRPWAGAFLDEVPLVLVYGRPGAWR